jgi:hypothetical protein
MFTDENNVYRRECHFTLDIKQRVNWKYAITTFAVLRYVITICEIRYMSL